MKASKIIYHVCHKSQLPKAGHPYIHPSLEAETFIHCATDQQVDGVLDRYFRDQSDLILLSIDEAKLSSPIKYEQSTNDELFPHIYGPINQEAIIAVHKIENE